jgi:hypothetical protein
MIRDSLPFKALRIFPIFVSLWRDGCTHVDGPRLSLRTMSDSSPSQLQPHSVYRPFGRVMLILCNILHEMDGQGRMRLLDRCRSDEGSLPNIGSPRCAYGSCTYLVIGGQVYKYR